MHAPPQLLRTDWLCKATNSSLDKNMTLPRRFSIRISRFKRVYKRTTIQQELARNSGKELAWKAGKGTCTDKKISQHHAYATPTDTSKRSRKTPQFWFATLRWAQQRAPWTRNAQGPRKMDSGSTLGPWRHLASTKRFMYTKAHERRRGRGEDLVLALPRDVRDHQNHAFRCRHPLKIQDPRIPLARSKK